MVVLKFYTKLSFSSSICFSCPIHTKFISCWKKTYGKHSQFTVTVPLFEAMSMLQQFQKLMVGDARIWSPSSGHNFPHGHSKGPLHTVKDSETLNKLFWKKPQKIYLDSNIQDWPHHSCWCRWIQKGSPWPSTLLAFGQRPFVCNSYCWRSASTGRSQPHVHVDHRPTYMCGWWVGEKHDSNSTSLL